MATGSPKALLPKYRTIFEPCSLPEETAEKSIPESRVRGGSLPQLHSMVSRRMLGRLERGRELRVKLLLGACWEYYTPFDIAGQGHKQVVKTRARQYGAVS